MTDHPKADLTGDPAPLPAGEAVVVLDRGYRVLGSNQAARQLLGADPLASGELFQPENLFAGPCLGEALAALDAALGQGRSASGLTGQAGDALGKNFDCEYSVNPLYGPSRQVTGLILSLRDLDYRPLRTLGDTSGDNLPHLPRLGYQALFENLAEGIFTINTRWRITSFNQTAETMTGYRRDEVLGRFCWEIFRSDLCETGCPLRTTLESGVTRMDQDVRMLGKGGKRISVLVNTSVVRDRARNVIGAVETFRPISGPESPLDDRPSSGQSFADIVGGSPGMQRLFDMLPDVAMSETSVLITGESGTGKELFARAIHHHSARAGGPFVAVNCSALAETLLESELFGHERAAFTGAVRSKVGRFELARGGTLFLDEIGELKPELQVKLLRVLEQRVFERVGGTRLINMDARIIAATNKNLTRALAEGSFREDLFYRLRTVPMALPPLRERPGDIQLLVTHFMRRLNEKTGKSVRTVDPKVMRMFMDYHWPGNVRELERVMEHAYVFAKGPVIFPANLPALDELLQERPAALPTPPPEEAPFGRSEDDEAARAEIVRALAACGGRRQAAAEMLGISRTSLWRRMREMGL